ncbi:MAG: SDR family oxidoreductase [Candidatus Omnitrophota bacterium]
MPQVLITGASGLLGQALCAECLNAGLKVLAQYHTHQPFHHRHLHWLHADFSDLNGIRDFLSQNQNELTSCEYLINNYGPMTSKELPELTAEDFLFDYHHNFITAFEITAFMIRHAPLLSVVNIGFEFADRLKPYKKIIPYAIAKNAMYVWHRSLVQRYPSIRFHMAFPTTLTGAAVAFPHHVPIPPESEAQKIVNDMLRKS